MNMMKTHSRRWIALLLIAVTFGCAPASAPPPGLSEADRALKAAKANGGEEGPLQLPARFQRPSYSLREEATKGSVVPSGEVMAVPVGADISSTTGPIALWDIMKRLATLKGMNISWANDVDQNALVDVDIRAEDDFFRSIDNILRQLDYFHSLEGKTIVIKHKDTRRFHIAMPFITSTYAHGLGGNVLGGGGGSGAATAGNMQGNLQLQSANNSFDIWQNIQGNLDKILDIWTAPVETAGPAGQAAAQPAAAAQPGAAAPVPATTAPPQRPTGRGYYTIDRPIGLITVTAPRSLLEKIDDYFRNLKSALYRQISIEAKIVEVTLSEDNTSGIDWADLLQNTTRGFNFSMDFQKLSPTYRTGNDARFLTLEAKTFTLFLDALHEQGKTDVIANPKLAVMNGQPAMISVGENVTYIDRVNSTVSDGVVTYSVTTSSVMSGLGLAVIATILDDNEVILNLTPVTSDLTEPIEYRQFGGLNEVGLPKVSVREMSTMVRVRDGEMLVVGGLIDSNKAFTSKKIPGLGDVPGVGKLFGTDGTVGVRKELIIFLLPRIIS